MDLPPVQFEGRDILERFCSETGDFFCVAPTSQDEYRQLRHLEARREELCIELLEANRLADARTVEKRLDLIRNRMKEVEILCRYTQSVYATVRAAHEPGFRPAISLQTAADNAEKARQELVASIRGENHTATTTAEEEGDNEQQSMVQRLFPPLKHDTDRFRLDERDFADTGYCLVFSCARDSHQQKQQQKQQQQQKSTTTSSSSSIATTSMKDFLTTEMARLVAAEKAEQDRIQAEERLMATNAPGQQQHQQNNKLQKSISAQKQQLQQHQLSFSCDGRIDEGHVTDESKVLSRRVQEAVDASLERLPLARWGDDNRTKGIETAVLATLDSIFGVVVARDKVQAEDFFRELRKSETIHTLNTGNFASASTQQRKSSDYNNGDEDNEDDISNNLKVPDFQQRQLRRAASSPATSSSPAVGTPLRFVKRNRRHAPVGKFTKTLSRVVPAGGSRACSDIIKQIVAERKSNQQQQQQQSTSPLPDEAWWMKAVGCPTVELCGIADALQKVVTECTPFMPQRAHDIVVRGGTVAGALDAPDDPRAAALCLVIDGDCGFDFTAQDVLIAADLFNKIVTAYFGEVVQRFGDYAVAVFWTMPTQTVLDEYEFDDTLTTQLPKGVALNRLSPATRAVLAAMELHSQVRRAACGVALAEFDSEHGGPRTNDEIIGRQNDDAFGLRERAYTYNKMGFNATGDYVNDRDREARMAQFRLRYNCRAHTAPLVAVTGAAVDDAVQLGLMAEKVLRRPVVVAAAAAKQCDSAIARLSCFSHNLVEYFTPISLETLRLEEPPAERLIGRYDPVTGTSSNAGGLGATSYGGSSTQQQQSRHHHDDNSLGAGMGLEEDDDVAVDLSRSVVTGFTVARKSNRKRVNFHSIHSEPTLRRLFVNLEPYRGCGYILRSQLKEALYPLCFVDPLRVQAGAALESELAAMARQKYEEFEANKYQSALAREASSGEELSPMEVMRLMLLKARKQQRQKDRERMQREKEGGGGGAAGAATTHGGDDHHQQHGGDYYSSNTKTMSERLKEQDMMREQANLAGGGGISNNRMKASITGNKDNKDGGVKSSLFNVEDTIGGKSKGRGKKRWEIQSDIHPDVLAMYKDIFGDDMVGVTHDVLDTMLTPLRNNKAQEHVTFPEFLLFAARLQAEG